jgi:hypothetical protein
MKRQVTSLDQLKKMKEKMDRVWDNLVEENPRGKDQEAWTWVDELPKFEGVGKMSSRSRFK